MQIFLTLRYFVVFETKSITKLSSVFVLNIISDLIILNIGTIVFSERVNG